MLSSFGHPFKHQASNYESVYINTSFCNKRGLLNEVKSYYLSQNVSGSAVLALDDTRKKKVSVKHGWNSQYEIIPAVKNLGMVYMYCMDAEFLNESSQYWNLKSIL